MYKENPFSLFCKNTKSNTLCFNNDSKKQKDSNSDFFLLEDNKQYRTKQRMGFYNNGNSSHVKQYLDYFLKSSNSNNLSSNSIKDKDKLENLSSSSNQKNFFNLSFNEFLNQNPINDNNAKKDKLDFKRDEISEEEKDCCCPPPCAKAINDSINNSFKSLTKSNPFNHNSKNEFIEASFNVFVNEFEQMSIEEKESPFDEKKRKVKIINPNLIEKLENITLKY